MERKAGIDCTGKLRKLAVAIGAVLTVGCGDEKALDPAPSSTLDTGLRTEPEFVIEIDRWVPAQDEWVTSTESVDLDKKWRFVSDFPDGDSVRVRGAYNITFTNPTSEIVDIEISNLTFADHGEVEIAGYELDPSDSFSLETNESSLRAGEFEIVLEDVSVTFEIAAMDVWATVEFREAEAGKAVGARPSGEQRIGREARHARHLTRIGPVPGTANDAQYSPESRLLAESSSLTSRSSATVIRSWGR